MKNNVRIIYFSPCGNVKKITETIGSRIVKNLESFQNAASTQSAESFPNVLISQNAADERVDEVYDFTLPDGRKQDLQFTAHDLVILGCPVYAGRIPNKIMPFIRDHIHGDGTKIVLIAAYGNRSYGDALAEMKLLTMTNGFLPIAAAAAVSEHSFSGKIAAGRPDESDLVELREFADKIADHLISSRETQINQACTTDNTENLKKERSTDILVYSEQENTTDQISSEDRTSNIRIAEVPGNRVPDSYYTPLKTDHTPARFLKAVPQVDSETCTSCRKCREVCPMGSVDPEDPTRTNGVCIKCQACIKACPVGARSFMDEDFLSHKEMLIREYSTRQESEYFIG